jgi:hypothetical protein
MLPFRVYLQIELNFFLASSRNAFTAIFMLELVPEIAPLRWGLLGLELLGLELLGLEVGAPSLVIYTIQI